MKSQLLKSGVKENNISVVLDEMEAVKYTLDMAREGDLVVLVLGNVAMKSIEEFMQDYIENYPSNVTER